MQWLTLHPLSCRCNLILFSSKGRPTYLRTYIPQLEKSCRITFKDSEHCVVDESEALIFLAIGQISSNIFHVLTKKMLFSGRLESPSFFSVNLFCCSVSLQVDWKLPSLNHFGPLMTHFAETSYFMRI